jgi:2-iminoacetate synthase
LSDRPAWLDPAPWLDRTRAADDRDVRAALSTDRPGIRDFAILLSEAAGRQLELMARRALALTRRRFGRTVSLYAPLYLSNYCPAGCAYCGFASDRRQRRNKLSSGQQLEEMDALKRMGIHDVLLLTGGRAQDAGFAYLRASVERAARHFDAVTVESFAMYEDEYRDLVSAGCTGVTLYQETYDPVVYQRVHRWGAKRDYRFRLDGPARALRAGMRTAGIGALFGLADPEHEAIALFQHALCLRKTYWQSGVSISFPRIQPESGGFAAPHPVSDERLAQMIFAFRICLPDVPLVLSTRERAVFRDGMAGVGISRMSVASRTTVGGYASEASQDEGQFLLSDTRDVKTFCAVLRGKRLEPVFKDWDAVYRQTDGLA